jgi:hypothetical protein
MENPHAVNLIRESRRTKDPNETRQLFRRIAMPATMSLSTLLSEFAESNIHSRKDLRSQFPSAISGAVLAIVLLVMAGLASAQDPMAYDFIGGPDVFGTIDLTTGTFSQSGNSGQLLAGLGVGPGGLLYGGAFQGAYPKPEEAIVRRCPLGGGSGPTA